MSPDRRLPALADLHGLERLLALHRVMVRIRAFEDGADEASQGGTSAFGQATSATPARVRGPLHLSHGQEAVPTGVCAHLALDDAITSTHRGHGHCIAKGADPWRMYAELFGRTDGFNAGKGGSMHIADFSVGMLGSNGVVAAGIPIAVGAAQAFRLRGEDRIVGCFFGDGAINRGPFLEGLNWAGIHRLPVLFVCEDNRYSATTRSSDMTSGDGVAARARALGIPATTCDGNDVVAVDALAAQLVARVRAGEGPHLLHAITYRFKGHVSVDPARYRDPDELSVAQRDDPIERSRERLLDQGFEPDRLATVEAEERQAIAAAMASALEAPWPAVAAAYEDIQDLGAGVWR
jgi:pyruvate dehydrogenase E1 component alpha subunit